MCVTKSYPLYIFTALFVFFVETRPLFGILDVYEEANTAGTGTSETQATARKN